MDRLRDPKDAKILFVDDEEVNLVLLGRILKRHGFEHLIATDDPFEAERAMREEDPDLLITDLHMPGMNGLELIRRVVADRPEDDWFPIAVITADATPEAEREALSLGAKDFVQKPFKATQIQLRVRNLLRTRFQHVALKGYAAHLEDLVEERTRELETARMDLLERLALAAEFRDYVTGRHTQRVGEMAALLAERLGEPPQRVELLRRAAPLHDVGKIGIPDSILLKPGRLADREYQAMKEHVDVGVQLLARGQSDLMKLAEVVALTHHERWDGSGYPRGLNGDAIPLVGQIVALADVFDTLVNVRPYKPAWPVEKALAEVRRQRGRWFGPRVVDAFFDVVGAHPELLEDLEREAREETQRAERDAERAARSPAG